jgi:hypothetical protein
MLARAGFVGTSPRRHRRMSRRYSIFASSGVSRSRSLAADRGAKSHDTEGTTLGWVLLQALHDYAAGTWTPQPDARSRPSIRRADGLTSTRG